MAPGSARALDIPDFHAGAPMKRLVLAAVLAAAVAVPAFAQVTVKEPWVRATVAHQQATGAFMQIGSAKGVRLVSAASPVAGIVEIHEMAMEGNVMRMRPVAGIEVPAGKSVELKPGGYHVMLMDLKRQLKEGEAVPITLTFEGEGRARESVEVKAAVMPIGASGPAQHRH